MKIAVVCSSHLNPLPSGERRQPVTLSLRGEG